MLAACRARLPERLVSIGERVGRAREDEEQIGEPIQVDGDEGTERVILRGPEGLPLGAPADRPRDVQAGCGRGAAGEDEALELWEVCVEPVAVLLEVIDEPLLDPQPALDLSRDGEVGAEVEQLVLDPLERRAERVGSSPASTTPSAALSSSTVPKATIRPSSFEAATRRRATSRRCPRRACRSA